jgi:uncharacterized protein
MLMTNNSNLTALVQTMYAAFGRGDIPALLARLRPDVEWQINVSPAAPGANRVELFRIFRGVAEVGNFFTVLGRELEFHAFTPVAFFAAEAGVAARVDMEWTQRRTQRRLRVESMHVFTFDGEGRLSAFREFTDTLGVAAAWDVIRAGG